MHGGTKIAGLDAGYPAVCHAHISKTAGTSFEEELLVEDGPMLYSTEKCLGTLDVGGTYEACTRSDTVRMVFLRSPRDHVLSYAATVPARASVPASMHPQCHFSTSLPSHMTHPPDPPAAVPQAIHGMRLQPLGHLQRPRSRGRSAT